MKTNTNVPSVGMNHIVPVCGIKGFQVRILALLIHENTRIVLLKQNEGKQNEKTCWNLPIVEEVRGDSPMEVLRERLQTDFALKEKNIQTGCVRKLFQFEDRSSDGKSKCINVVVAVSLGKEPIVQKGVSELRFVDSPESFAVCMHESIARGIIDRTILYEMLARASKIRVQHKISLLSWEPEALNQTLNQS